MCKVYNSIGCLTTILDHLNLHNIYDINSTQEIIEFQKSYSRLRQQIISQHEFMIEREKSELQLDLIQLDDSIKQEKLKTENSLTLEINNLKQSLFNIKDNQPKNPLLRFIQILKQRHYRKLIQSKENSFDIQVNNSIKELLHQLNLKNNRIHFINSNFEGAVRQSYKLPMEGLERKKRVLEEVSSFIAGAIGEQSVVRELERLSDDHHLINDFNVSFSKSIYNRQENDYIKSIQVDHILISPSGVFLIETKNWSEASLNNLNLRSPVQQIKRNGYVLYRLLNNDIANFRFKLDQHRWGDKKIPMKNLIVLTHSKPNEEFQYVKILTLKELPGYINYFKPVLSNIETQRITDYLLTLNAYKTLVIS